MIIPILTALQHIYARPTLRDSLLDAVAQDVNGVSSADCGRPGMQYWSILVLGAVRLGCNLNYDRLQNLAEEHPSRIVQWLFYSHPPIRDRIAAAQAFKV